MLRPILRQILKPILRPLFRGVAGFRWAYNFDGVDDRGRLAFRAINPDSDNAFEFWKPENLCTIIAQNISATESAREFQLWQGGVLELNLTIGGATTNICTVAQGYTSGSKYFLTLTGTMATLAKDISTNVIRTTTFTRGAAREPSAVTLIGCRGNGAESYAQFFNGLQYDIRINGTLWPMGDRNQPIQLPSPSGLGAELITQSVLENPASKGTQWTYLGAGRWQYIGDGSFNELVFISAGNQPEAGFLEFEVESIAGSMRCYTTVASVGTLQSNPFFSTTGRFRYYYTSKAGLGGSGNFFSFFRNGAGVVVSCIIKNISFKPLGTCNPMTLVNTTSDRWQEINQ